MRAYCKVSRQLVIVDVETTDPNVAREALADYIKSMGWPAAPCFSVTCGGAKDGVKAAAAADKGSS